MDSKVHVVHVYLGTGKIHVPNPEGLFDFKSLIWFLPYNEKHACVLEFIMSRVFENYQILHIIFRDMEIKIIKINIINNVSQIWLLYNTIIWRTLKKCVIENMISFLFFSGILCQWRPQCANIWSEVGNEEYEVKPWKNLILFSKLNFTYKPVEQRTALSKCSLDQYFHLYTTCAF